MRGNKLTLNILVMFFLLVLSVAFMSVVINNDKNTAYAEAQVATINQSSKFADSLNITNENFYNISKSNTIIDISLNSKAFIQEAIIQEETKDYNIAKVSEKDFSIEIQRQYSYFKVLIPIVVVLTNNNKLEVSIYIYENEYGVFFSDVSIEKAEEIYIDYALDASLITKAEYEELYSQIYQIEPTSKQLKGTKGNKDTYANGTVVWFDDGSMSHPLREVKVELYDKNSASNDKCLATSYTNQNGDYSFTFQNNDSIFDNGGSDIYVKVYAGDDNVCVKDENTQVYAYAPVDQGHLYNNVSTGSTTHFSNITFYMNNITGQAMQISQPLIVARDFAQSQKGSMPTDTYAIYPYPGATKCSYNSSNGYIKICDNMYSTNMNVYASWDTIMHEYGHHIQHWLNTSNSPGYNHPYNRSLIGFSQETGHVLNKDEAIRLAWGEAWVDVFAIIAQFEYNYDISTISTVYDECFTTNTGVNFNLESDLLKFGEACEGAIASILWDLYDSNSNNEENDIIDLTASQWWDVTAVSGIYTFSAFVQNFISQNIGLMDALGKNLSYYYMSVWGVDTYFPSNSTPTTPPEIVWNIFSGNMSYPHNGFYVIADNYDSSYSIELAEFSGGSSYTLTQAQWNTILAWPGTTFKVRVLSLQQSDPITGIYPSEVIIVEKPIYNTRGIDNNSIEIIGAFNQLNSNLFIPSSINGKTVVGIANNAFNGKTEITYVNIPSTVTYIGAHAFDGCTSLEAVALSLASITRIEDYLFYNCPLDDISWNQSMISEIGNYAFYGTALSTVALSSNITYVGYYAFGNCSNLTIYSANDSATWDSNWNPSNRPFIHSCTFSASYSYVISFQKTLTNPMLGYNGTISNFYRGSYSFDGWYATSDYTGEPISLNSSYVGVLYSKWIKESSSCITTGSLITLADGSQVAVENLTGNEELLVWDMYTGTFSSAPILFMDVDPTTTYNVIKLGFSDGTIVNVIDEHAFFDITLNKYVFLRADASQYIGHFFSKHNLTLTGTENVQLMSVTIEQEVTTAYSPVTYGHLCYYVNGMLSMPGNTESFINIFEVDSLTMAYDETLMMQDIATYGLYTYEEFNSIIPLPELAFNAFNGQYLKVAIGKGITTLDEIAALLDRYSVFFE